MIPLKFKLVDSLARLPTYATDGSACFDFCAAQSQNIYPGTARSITTGLKAEIPEGYALMLYGRSGMAIKAGISLANCVGVVDSDYRGEIVILLRNNSEDIYSIQIGDRIAQGMLIKVPSVRILQVDEISETARGEGGFGSTGS